MSDAKFLTQQVIAGDTSVDNDSVTTSPGGQSTTTLRQRVRLGGGLGTALSDVVSAVGGAANSLGHLLVGSVVERTDGTIGAVSTLGASSAAGINGAEGTSNSTLLLVSKMNHSSWTVQTTGTWVGTMTLEVTAALDPTASNASWVPVNSRQSAGGRLANNWTSNGIFRGSAGGVTGLRVRATSWTSGTATVNLVAGEVGATFQNSDVVVQSMPQYYASSAGMNTMWGVANTDVALAAGTGEQPVLVITNTDPIGGRVLYIFRISVGASAAVRFKRYRSNTLSRTSGGTLINPTNRALGAQVDSAGRASAATTYSGTAIVTANVPAVPEKTIYLTGTDNDTSDENGSIILPPGQSMYFTATQAANGTLVAVEVVYWDGTNLT